MFIIKAVLYKRSVFRRVFVLAQVGVYSDGGFVFTMVKAHWTQEKATRLLLSQLAEDAIKRINFDETEALNHAQCLERNTAVLVSTALASKEHRHIEIDASFEPTDRLTNIKVKNSNRYRYAAAPRVQAKTIDFKWIKCPRRKQTWSSMSPDQMNYPVADLELLAYVDRREIAIDESDVFAKNAVIFSDSNIIVKADTDDCWYAGLCFLFKARLVDCIDIKALCLFGSFVILRYCVLATKGYSAGDDRLQFHA